MILSLPNVNRSSMFSVSFLPCLSISHDERVVSVCKQISVCVCVWRCCIWYNLYPMCIFLPLLSCLYEGSENELGARYFLLPVHACPLPHLDDTFNLLIPCLALFNSCIYSSQTDISIHSLFTLLISDFSSEGKMCFECALMHGSYSKLYH